MSLFYVEHTECSPEDESIRDKEIHQDRGPPLYFLLIVCDMGWDWFTGPGLVEWWWFRADKGNVCLCLGKWWTVSQLFCVAGFFYQKDPNRMFKLFEKQ